MRGIEGWRTMCKEEVEAFQKEHEIPVLRKSREMYICDEEEMVAFPCWTINGIRYRVFHKGVEVIA